MIHISPKVQKVLLIVAVVLSLLAVGGVMYARQYYYNNLEPVSASQREVTVTIEKGSTVNQIGELLEEKGLIRNARVFSQYVRNQGAQEQLKAGTYALRPSYTVEEVVTVLSHGAVQKDLLTILPGQRIDQIIQTFIDAGYSADEVDAALDPAQYKDHPALVDKPANANLEGYLYPESFQRTAETKAATIIKQSLDQMHQRLTPELRSQLTENGLSLYENIILASIVEQEVSTAQDREKVAQVFLKRLNMGMKLESDPTVRYGAVLAGKGPVLTFPTRYSTYAYNGLPPTPISNVSQSSLLAVANPAKTDWLFFVAGDDGTTHYSKTLEEHEANIERYCTTLCGR
ncbi:endolytic transglycosylase MltG [Patescibacteria group bacterium]|nr:MAG: endolytic transglycosylase MltG [Patescibacteria group bacterium]